MIDVDQFISEFVSLKQRVADLEKAAYSEASEYVEGWSNAAKLLGVSNLTCMKRARLGKLPKPCRVDRIERADGKVHCKLTWRRSDLVAYAEGREFRNSNVKSRR